MKADIQVQVHLLLGLITNSLIGLIIPMGLLEAKGRTLAREAIGSKAIQMTVGPDMIKPIKIEINLLIEIDQLVTDLVVPARVGRHLHQGIQEPILDLVMIRLDPLKTTTLDQAILRDHLLQALILHN